MPRSFTVKSTPHERELEIVLPPSAQDGALATERTVIFRPLWASAPVTLQDVSAGDYLSAARQLLETLAAMHARGISHVDIYRQIVTGVEYTDTVNPYSARGRRMVPEADFPPAYHAVPEIGWADWMPRGDPRGALQRPGFAHDPYTADVWMAGNALQRAGDDLLAPLLARMMHAKPCVRPSAEEALAAVVAMQRIQARTNTIR